MQEKEPLILLANRVFGLHISEESDARRNAFCPSKNQFRCSCSCPIYQTYFHRGLSCNQALDRYPVECIRLMNEKDKERDLNEK